MFGPRGWLIAIAIILLVLFWPRIRRVLAARLQAAADLLKRSGGSDAPPAPDRRDAVSAQQMATLAACATCGVWRVRGPQGACGRQDCPAPRERIAARS